MKMRYGSKVKKIEAKKFWIRSKKKFIDLSRKS